VCDQKQTADTFAVISQRKRIQVNAISGSAINRYIISKKMTNLQTTLNVKIVRNLHWVEKIAIALLFLCGLLAALGKEAEAQGLLMVSLGTLSTVFFLYANAPPQGIDKTEQPMGFKELLTLLIIPKVLWISLAISTIGILFYFLNLKGYNEMLLIGGTSLLFALVLLAVLFLNGAKYLDAIRPVLMRAVTVLVIDIYIFYLVAS